VPRPPRLDAPGATHHVWARAVEGRPIFLESRDGDWLVRRLDELCAELRARCFAWALMSNHLHLVIRTHDGRLSALVHRLHTSFAAQFNLSRGRKGHVFQSRFGSRVARDDADLTGLILYVHRNPVAGGLASDLRSLARYAWCGHGALVGRRAPHSFELVDEALALFGDERRASIRTYEAWLGRAAGDDLRRPDSLLALIREVCTELGVSEADLVDGRKAAPVSEARSRICRRGVLELGVRNRDLARRLNLTEGAVSQALRRVTKAPGQTPS